MAKLILNDLTNLQNEGSVVNTINNNNAATEIALENTLSRDGTNPNQMEADLDMNSNRILNLPLPDTASEPLRLGDLDLIEGIPTAVVTDFGQEILAMEDPSELAALINVVAGPPSSAADGITLFADASGDVLKQSDETGIIAANSGVILARTITGTANEITVTNGTGVSGDPTLSIPSAVTFTGKTVTGGTYSTLDTDLAVVDGGTGASDATTARTNLGVAIGTNVQAYDADLDAISALSSTGLIARTGAGTAAVRTLTAPAAGITISNGDGVSGNPTLALADDLSALEGQSGTGLMARTASNTYAHRTLTQPAAGITVSNGDGISGNPTLALANDLSALEGLASTGIAARTATDTWAQRTITGTANEITLTNGNGVSGNPTVSLPSALTFTGKTVTGGTFSSLSTDIAVADGGTGASNESDARDNLGLTIGSDVQAYDSTLASLASYNTNGLLTQTAADTFTGRTVAASTGLSVTNGSGVSGNPTIALDINALDVDASPSGANDYVLSWDASTSSHKKVLMDNLPGGGGGGGLDINGLDPIDSVVGADEVPVYDVSTTSNKKTTALDIVKLGTGRAIAMALVFG